MLEMIEGMIERIEDEEALLAVEPGERERLQERYEALLELREKLLAKLEA